jgi:hypothetical protein
MRKGSDELMLVSCPKCKSSCSIAFMVLNTSVEQQCIMMYALCEYCFARGDGRSLVGAIKLDAEAFRRAYNSGLSDLAEMVETLEEEE